MSYKISITLIEGEDYFTRITIKNCIDYEVTDHRVCYLREGEKIWSYYKLHNGELVVIEEAKTASKQEVQEAYNRVLDYNYPIPWTQEGWDFVYSEMSAILGGKSFNAVPFKDISVDFRSKRDMLFNFGDS